MAFKKGISGNPGGKSGTKIFTDALRLERISLPYSSLERDFCHRRQTRQTGPGDDISAQRLEIRDQACVLGAVILARIVWLMSYVVTLRTRVAQRLLLRRNIVVPTVKGGMVVAWCGMRGIVTLAAAFALPEKLSLSRPDPADGCRRGARLARHSRPDASPADPGAQAEAG